MRIPKLNFSNKYIFEFFSISIAVFLGFMMNNWKEDYQHNKMLETSLKDISQEIKINKAKLETVMLGHQELLTQIEDIIENNYDSTIRFKYNLNFKMLNSTAWEVCKLSKSISHMNVIKARKIASVYEFQDMYQKLILTHLKNQISYNKKKDCYEEFLTTINSMHSLLKIIVPIEEELNIYYAELQIT